MVRTSNEDAARMAECRGLRPLRGRESIPAGAQIYVEEPGAERSVEMRGLPETIHGHGRNHI